MSVRIALRIRSREEHLAELKPKLRVSSWCVCVCVVYFLEFKQMNVTSDNIMYTGVMVM